MGYFKERFKEDVKELVDKYGVIDIKGIDIKGLKFTKDVMRDKEGMRRAMIFLLEHIDRRFIEEHINDDTDKLAKYILFCFEDLIKFAYTIVVKSDKIKKVFRSWGEAVRDMVNELVLLNNANLYKKDLYRYLVYDNPNALRFITELTAYMRKYLLEYEYGDVDNYYASLKEISRRIR